MCSTKERKTNKQTKKHRIQETEFLIEKNNKRNSENDVEGKIQDTGCVAGLESKQSKMKQEDTAF